MASFERITVTLPAELLHDLDRRENNRSKFVAVAVRKELDFRRREELQRSLQHPHPESGALASAGLHDWHKNLAQGKSLDRSPRDRPPELTEKSRILNRRTRR